MERIHVSVRARPVSPEEAKTSPWKISSNSIFISNQPAFKFDRIYRQDCKTIDVYEARTKEIVSATVRGFNGTVLAYGQTNSGKTHTMRGSTIEPGIISLAVHDLFDIISQDTSREYLLRMSYLEIYNENINDLLDPLNRKLQIHENLEKGVFVAGLREDIVDSPQQVLELMESGESHRHIGETNMNHYSSRSHTIFRMIIESREKTRDEGVGNVCDAVSVSVLNVVDLAGSERAAKTGAEGVRLKEGTHINKSLMTLGTVIKKLSEGVENQGGHIPYRDSKLTRILQPALGGNANTAIICNITLALIHVNETKSSLQFASRALRVTNCAHVNEILTDTALLKRQSKEIKELRSKLKIENELDRVQREYEDLLVQYETERTINEIQIEYLKAKLGEDGLPDEAKSNYLVYGVVGNAHWNENVIIREPEANIVVKQLTDKINKLEIEKSSLEQKVIDTENEKSSLKQKAVDTENEKNQIEKLNQEAQKEQAYGFTPCTDSIEVRACDEATSETTEIIDETTEASSSAEIFDVDKIIDVDEIIDLDDE
ncbi:kinesin-like protein KIN-7O isoform X2 [Arabidopsis lyrata subsp. lyrata]|uniref:kinesin-like protein KIN-7O isoform X2 n=1 Tax=Arabidopsis lyrata subsp. lyrata TaxID=81972 RepID=UPI000A29D561|nr:kinesin-like protein KIN-7O isoform X2 [Arabidopsis lyrata subsp. lyrata]|eukprot:XP_020885438.1 kinesin-like protein KIN-7O isoform X2 [Arabidopsis lyrata subsp. lyrata]